MVSRGKFKHLRKLYSPKWVFFYRGDELCVTNGELTLTNLKPLPIDGSYKEDKTFDINFNTEDFTVTRTPVQLDNTFNPKCSDRQVMHFYKQWAEAVIHPSNLY